MEMSFGTHMKEAGGFDGIVLPGRFDLTLKGGSGSRMRAWCLLWVLPELSLTFLPRICVLCPEAKNVDSGMTPIAAGTQPSLLLVPGCWVWRSLPPAIAAIQIFQTSRIDPTTGPRMPPSC